MVTRVFQLLLFISPIAIGADMNMDMFDIIFFRTGVIILFVASLFDKPKREMPQYIIYALVSLLGLCLFNLFNHAFNSAVLFNVQNVFLSVLAFHFIYCYYDTNKDLKKFILGAALINFLYFLIQSAGFDFIFDKTIAGDMNGGFLGNTARLANYLTLITAFLPLYLLPISILFGLLVKQYVLFIPVIIISFLKIKTKRTRILCIISLILLAVFLRQHIIGSFSVRLNNAWMPMLKAYFDQPLIGLGLGIYPSGIQTGVILNSFLQIIAGLGIFAVVWFGYIFKTIYEKIGLKNLTIPFLTLVLLMLVEYPIEMVRLWFLIIAILIIFLTKKEVTDGRTA